MDGSLNCQSMVEEEDGVTWLFHKGAMGRDGWIAGCSCKG